MLEALTALASPSALAGLEPLRYRYAVSLGERLRLLQPQGEPAEAMRDWLRRLPADAPSGDVHAWLAPPSVPGD